jgi:pimeloyl-ACP methyl ester carboxylesterase
LPLRRESRPRVPPSESIPWDSAFEGTERIENSRGPKNTIPESAVCARLLPRRHSFCGTGGIEQHEQVDVLRNLIASLGTRPVFVGGISFGGAIALRYAIEHPGTIAGLVPMSSFAELSPQLMRIGMALRTALILGGTTYLQDLLFPMNFSDAWLEAKADLIGLATQRGWLINDVYALQNLMDSFLNFEPLTSQLGLIRAPTMIMSGEFDFLTPPEFERLGDQLTR